MAERGSAEGTSGRRGGRGLAGFLAVFEAIALAVQLQDVDVVGQSIEQRAGQPFGPEDLGPFVEGQIRGHERRRLLVALGEDLEEQLGAGLRQRHIAELVDDQQILLGELLLKTQQALVIPRLENARLDQVFSKALSLDGRRWREIAASPSALNGADTGLMTSRARADIQRGGPAATALECRYRPISARCRR